MRVWVAPRAGAWIEIDCCQTISAGPAVAPRAGAWIEIDTPYTGDGSGSGSLPVRERGLKSVDGSPKVVSYMSLPVRERGLK